MTFADLAAERLDNGDPLRPGTRRDYQHVLGKDVLPTIGNIPAKAVTRDDVIGVLDVISSRGANRRADTARGERLLRARGLLDMEAGMLERDSELAPCARV